MGENLRTAIVNLVGGNRGQNANDFVFSSSTKGTDIDPYVEVVVKRAAALRRLLARRPEYRGTVDRIMAAYRDRGDPGLSYKNGM